MDESHEPEQSVSRREFLKEAARDLCWVVVLTGGAGAALSSLKSARAQDDAPSPDAPRAPAGGKPDDSRPEYKPEDHDWVYLIDITKCIGCGSCVRACEAENDVPPDFFRTWVERYRVSRTGEVEIDSPDGARDGFKRKVARHLISKAFFVPKICNHCTSTPCVQLCPVGASYRSPDGLILVDEDRCMGCSYCVQACPYGSRFIHPKTHAASKCTFCYHRITRGMKPACVQACPVGARRHGDRKKPGDEVSEYIATKPIHLLKPELLTEPNCYYAGLTEEVK